MTDEAPDPQEPGDPQRGQYPEYPTGPEGLQPAATASRLRPRRVWAGIGLASLGHLIVICASFVLNAFTSEIGGIAVVLPAAELALLAACVGGGIALMRRGDRSLGVGLLIGWAVGAVVFAGACVALIVVVANALGG